MIDIILATADTTANSPEIWPTITKVNIIPCIMLLLVIAFCGLIIYGIIQLIRFLASSRKEQKLIRMELGKVAEEVHLLREELKGKEEGNSASQSE